MSKKVFVGMSGGVDSSVTAALLKEQGYDVTGVYMKNWSQDLPGMVCPWKQDYQDAKRVAVQLDIPFKMYDFETEYRERVVDYMLEGYKAGITPNPDIMCNQEVKFKLFYYTAISEGADFIATGHYARVNHNEDDTSVWPAGRAQLWTGKDTNKDQSYFLYRVTSNTLSKSLMPIGGLTKPEVRELARKYGLATADKKDSQGICFVGKVGIKDFLKQFVSPDAPGMGPGAIVDREGRNLGEHEGALFYTIGQRHGLDVGGGLPYYVIGKDMDKNEVYVTTDLSDPGLWKKELELTSLHWINEAPSEDKQYFVRSRYRAPLVKCTVSQGDADHMTLTLDEEVRAVTPGQSAVIYDRPDGDTLLDTFFRVVGGGVVV